VGVVRVPGLSLGAIYLFIGAVVAAANEYFDQLGTATRVGEAIVAVIIWPFVLAGYHVNLQ
jgi:hypothetical protein